MASTWLGPATPAASDAPASPQQYGLEALPELRCRIRKHVDEIIRQTTPLDRKAAYVEAVSKAPRLVATETDPLQFVRYCNYDVWAGADRLCRYWTERKALFGERAFLPLTLTGNGALNSEDVMSLHAGHPAVLPNTTAGQKVVLFDRRKWLPNATTENRLRCLFYIMGVVAASDTAQVDGVLVLVVLLTSPRRPHWDYVNSGLALLAHAFPVKTHFHIFNTPNQKKQYLVQDMMNTTAQVVFRHMNKSINMHTERDSESIMKAFYDLGFRTEGIPQGFGGQWKFEQFFEWCMEQTDAESKQYGSAVQTVFAAGAKGKKKRSLAEAEETEDDKAKRKVVELIQSRRKRERKQAQVANLESEAKALVNENRQLHAEHRRLNGLLDQAKQILRK